MKTYIPFLATTLLVATTSSVLAQYSAYLPDPHQLLVTPGYSYQTFDHFWAGRTKMALTDLGLGGHLEQHTFQASLEYGIASRFAVDATLGYVTTRFPARNQTGLTDTGLGVRYAIYQEFQSESWLPSLTLRVGGIVQGSYRIMTGLPPTHPGDGASGFETSLLFGRRLGSSGLALYGDIGYRNRSEGVPDDVFGTAGLQYSPLEWLSVHAAYRHEQSLSGIDILSSSFTGNWQVVKEINRVAEFGATFTDSRGRTYTLFGAFNLSSRNTGDKTIVGIFVSLPFKLK